MERGPVTGPPIAHTRKSTSGPATRKIVYPAESLNTNSHPRSLRFCSAGLALTGVLMSSACEHTRTYEDRPHLDPNWIKSSYQLPLEENLRLKREALSAAAEGNREICGAILQHADNNETLELFFAENASIQSHSFELSAPSIRRIRKVAKHQESSILGSFHSHPTSDATPGRNDINHAGVLSLLMIHSVKTGQTRLWQVVLRDGIKKAREIQLKVIGHRLRGPSPLTPSPREPALRSPLPGDKPPDS